MKWLLFILFLPLALFAQTPIAPPVLAPDTLDQVVGLLPSLINAFKQGHFLLAGAVSTLIVTFVLKQYILPKLNLGTGILPLASTVIGILIGWAISVIGGATAVQAMLAVMSGPLASNLWDLGLKYFVAKPLPPVA